MSAARYMKPRWLARLAMCLLATGGFVGANGCAAVQGVSEYVAYNDTSNDFVLGWRNIAWARQAWKLRYTEFLGEPHLDHFGAGFRAGYIDVASGSTGCTPSLPPRSYWNWRYQTPEGQMKVAAWFSGYPHGARAAEEDGAGNWSHIQISETTRAEYQLGHEPPYNRSVWLYNAADCCPPESGHLEGGSTEYLPGSPVPMAPSEPMDMDYDAWTPKPGSGR
jgi:hypothetical protein